MIAAAAWLPVLVPATSLLAAAAIFCMREDQRWLRASTNIGIALLKVVLVVLMLYGVYQNQFYEFKLHLFGRVDLVLHADPLSLLFVSLSALLWLVTTIYAIAYLEHGTNRSRFFGFFSLCVSATTGIALAGNVLTFLLFYELLTLSTYPLVVHRGTEQAIRAGRTYLVYTVGGGALLFLAVSWLYTLAGPAPFLERGSLAGLHLTHPIELRIIFALFVAGLGVKAALVPLHGWLPLAMVAPAPVSALLHAVAVVKAGAFGLIRVVYDLYGIALCRDLGVLFPLGIAAAFTIVYGSVRALFQDDLKRRLAFSTVSQVSYITLGITILGPLATTGGIVHLVHQGLMKITLFLCAGNFAERLHIHRISEMDGLGRRMPWSTVAFSLAAFGMIGVPPMAGFVSKWYIGLGAIQAGSYWVIPVLLASSGLNAAYFLPILYRVWFKPPAKPLTAEDRLPRDGIHPGLLWPAVATCLLALLSGLLAGTGYSPLAWARLITAWEYGL